jgi:hypothetical protein
LFYLARFKKENMRKEKQAKLDRIDTVTEGTP